MKTKLFITFLACVVASVLMSSCSEEDRTYSNGQPTAFTGGIITEAPMERVQIGTSESSTVVPGFLTRTSMSRDSIGGHGTFFWESTDAIYVEDDGGRLCKGQNSISDAVERTTFLVRGSFNTKGPYNVYYCGTNSEAREKEVVIANFQCQVAFNDTKHFGAVGDCGVAQAVKNTDPGMRGYKFNLEHKASYLCFLPYADNTDAREYCKIRRIEIFSDNTIAGIYDLTQTGLSATGMEASNAIALDVGTDGLELADQTTDKASINNSLYVVIAPGKHSLTIRCLVEDRQTRVANVVTTYLLSHTFAANQICDIPINLSNATSYCDNAEFRKNFIGWAMWNLGEYHDKYGYATTPLFLGLPSHHVMRDYLKKCDPHWVDDGKNRGVWLKKRQYFSQKEQKEQNIMKYGRPARSEIYKYFFLPVLPVFTKGGYTTENSTQGEYWLSTVRTDFNWEYGSTLIFTPTFIEIGLLHDYWDEAPLYNFQNYVLDVIQP